MKVLRDVLILVVVAGIFAYFVGSWTLIPIAFLSGIFYEKLNSKRLWIGLIAGFCLWFGFAIFLDLRNDHLLSAQIGQLLGNLSGPILLLITGLMGALLASLSRYLGVQIFDMTIKSRQKTTVSN